MRIALFALGYNLVFAQNPGAITSRKPGVDSSEQIRVGSQLVLIPVSVTDRENHPVLGLAQSNFHVFEGREEQHVIRLLNEDSPVAVCLAFDTSHSMQHKLDTSRLAVERFLDVANPEDEFCLVDR